MQRAPHHTQKAWPQATSMIGAIPPNSTGPLLELPAVQGEEGRRESWGGGGVMGKEHGVHHLGEVQCPLSHHTVPHLTSKRAYILQ